MPKLINLRAELLDAEAMPHWLTLAQFGDCAQTRDQSTQPGALNGRIGLVLHGGDDLAPVAGALQFCAAVAVQFPRFTDGRGLTIAQQLRSRYGWGGPLWALGDILRDQLFALARVGFDHFALRDDQNELTAAAAFHDYEVRYQASWDSPQPLWGRHDRTVVRTP